MNVTAVASLARHAHLCHSLTLVVFHCRTLVSVGASNEVLHLPMKPSNTFQARRVHITNELIHNPEVNENLENMNVQFIEKRDDGTKSLESVQEGDVVILPAFGASYEEMDYFDKKVSMLV